MSIDLVTPRPAVSVLLVREGHILLVRRGHQPNLGLWSLPGGSVEPGETIRQAAAREVFEETALVVEAGSVAGVFDAVIRESGVLKFHYIIICLRATLLSGDLRAGSDADEARWVPLSEIAAYQTTEGLTARLQEMGVLE